MTTIESLLGENKENLTKLLSQRIGKVLGATADDVKQLSQRFEQLYNFRSRLVHGDEELLPRTKAEAKHLKEARDMAREILVWFLQFLDFIQTNLQNISGTLGLPKRSEILRTIDLDAGSNARVKKLLELLPNGFPHIRDWSKASRA